MTDDRLTTSPAPIRPDVPTAIGRYRVVRRLGEGGMGSVFLAEDPALGRLVALKLPLDGTADRPEVRERFFREARSAATIDHPGICPVYDIGEADGRPYLAMAYIEGESLDDVIGTRRPSPVQSAILVGKLAVALQEAHRRGVVHRDLKPSNIMIRTAGGRREPILVDFGLARFEGPGDARITRDGQVVGTPAYMAPEQLRGEEVDAGSDVYSLGVVLYELLAGRPPFSGPYPVVISQILTQSPLPPSDLSPGIDPRLEAICLRMMTRDRAGRHASMGELARDLAEYLRDAPARSAVLSDPIGSRVEAPATPMASPTPVVVVAGPARGAGTSLVWKLAAVGSLLFAIGVVFATLARRPDPKPTAPFDPGPGPGQGPVVTPGAAPSKPLRGILRATVASVLGRHVEVFGRDFADTLQPGDRARRGTSYQDVFADFLPQLQALKVGIESGTAGAGEMQRLLAAMKRSKAYTDAVEPRLRNGDSGVGQKHYRRVVEEIESILRTVIEQNGR